MRRRLLLLPAAVFAATIVWFAGAAQSADTLDVHLVSETSTTLTLGWTPQPGYGYLFFQDCVTIDTGCVLVARTNDANASTATFQKGHNLYKVAVITEGDRGVYTAVDPPGPPTASFTITPSPAVVGQSVTFDWTGSCAAGGCTFVWEDEGPDGPGGTDWPLGTGDPYIRTFVSVGTKYIHLVVTDSAGNTAESRQQLVVSSAPPAPAQCADGIDNDGDTLIDLADPGCTGSSDNDETNVPPPPPAQCTDTLDNDGDGLTDYPADPGCTSASDNDETDAPPPPTGNVFISPAGNDGNACTTAAPCRTLQRGYAAAASGNTISVANGSYPGTSLSGTKTVTFQVASGTASITTRLAFSNLQNATFNGPFVSTVPGEQDWALTISGSSRNLLLNDISGSHFNIGGCSADITMNGGSWGGYSGRPWAGDTMIGGDETGIVYACGEAVVRNITLDGVRFHDVQYGPSSGWGGAHPDCLESHGAFENLVIKNGVFERCGNTFIGTYLDWGNFHSLTIENNLMRDIFDSVWGVQIGNKPAWVCEGITFRYNTYATDVPPLINCPTDPSGGHVYGNIFSSRAVCGQAVWSFNIWGSGTLCGTNSFINSTPGFVGGGDFHLADGAFAIGKGDPSRFPATDFEGTARTSPPDAGYDERG